MDTRTPRQMHALPSERGSGPGLGFVARPRRRARRVALTGVLVVVAAVGWRGAAEAPATHAAEDTDAGVRAAAPDATPPVADDATASEDARRPAAADVQPFAAVGDLVVSLPSTDVLVVGYHEASLPGVLAMRPIGTGTSNSNTTASRCRPTTRTVPPTT